MSEENYFYVTIPLLSDATHSKFFVEENIEIYKNKTQITKVFSGLIYFENPFVKNDKSIKNYMDGTLVGKIDVYQAENESSVRSYIQVDANNSYEDRFQNLSMQLICTSNLFESLEIATQNKSEIRIKFKINEWLDINEYSDYFRGKCQTSSIEILAANSTNEDWLAQRHVREIKHYLLTEFCGRSEFGQFPTICKELSAAFSKLDIYNKRNVLIEPIRDLLENLKLYLEIEKSNLRIEIEEDDDLELAKLFSLRGIEFDTQFEKITDPKKRRELLSEYNTVWKRVDAIKMFNDGYAWNGQEFPMLAEEYLKIPYINSPTLNKILVDGLIARDIAETATHFQYSDKMSSDAILAVPKGEYVKSDLEVKNKSIKEILLLSGFKLVGVWIGMLISGLFIWWVTSLIASDNEMAHYILFGSIFSASLIIGSLNQRTTAQAIKENREEHNFYILRDMCALHKQAEHMDTKLLRHLMYKLEERGIQINNYIYEILKRSDSSIY